MLRQNCLRVFKEQVIGTINLEHRKKIFYRAMLRSHSHSLKSHIESTYSHIYKLYFCNVFSVSLNFFLNLRPISIALQSFFKKILQLFQKLVPFFLLSDPHQTWVSIFTCQKHLVINCLQNSLCFPSRVEVCLILSFLSMLTGFLGY